MYGLTECKRVSYLPPHLIDVKPASVGVAIPGTEVWVEDADGNECAPGEVGELIVRGPHVMQGYWNDHEATAKRLRPGRWPWERELMTGDLFKRDAEGHLYFVGRKDDMIKSRGEKVAPREVEEVLYAVPGVRDAAVIGVPDALLGSAIHAYVSVFEDAELDERMLKRACAAKLEDYMVPQRIEIRDELPRSTAGKIDKLVLSAEALRAPRRSHCLTRTRSTRHDPRDASDPALARHRPRLLRRLADVRSRSPSRSRPKTSQASTWQCSARRSTSP